MNKLVFVAAAVVSFLFPITSFSQGLLGPSGAPEPTMRTLDQLYDYIGAAQTQISQLQAQMDSMSNRLVAAEAQVTSLSNRLEMTYDLTDAAYLWAMRAAESAAAATSRVAQLAASQSPLTRTPVTTMVDTNGFMCSMTVKSNGYPAIAFMDENRADLKYAEWDGVQWIVQTVYTNGYTGYSPSLAMQLGTDLPAISFYNAEASNLMYAAWNGAAWQVSVVDSAGNVGSGCSLAFHSSGNPAISYCDLSNGRIKYAGWNGSSWVFHTLTTDVGGTNFSAVTSLAFTGGGALPAIAFLDPRDSFVHYAAWNGATWQIEIVDSSVVYGAGFDQISLVFTPGGEPAITFYDHFDPGLFYAEHSSGSWNIQLVDSGVFMGLMPDLAFNSAGQPCISYMGGSESLKYAEWNGSSWDRQVVAKYWSGYFTSLAFSPLGHPIISHYGLSDGVSGLIFTEILPAP